MFTDVAVNLLPERPLFVDYERLLRGETNIPSSEVLREESEAAREEEADEKAEAEEEAGEEEREKGR
jgi:hypothetical protein